jgi:hypothetical protein
LQEGFIDKDFFFLYKLEYTLEKAVERNFPPFLRAEMVFGASCREEMPGRECPL